MRRANIFQANRNTIIAYLTVVDESNGRFNLYDIENNEYFAYGNIRQNRIDIYDSETSKWLEYGTIEGSSFNLYSAEDNTFIKFGRFL